MIAAIIKVSAMVIMFSMIMITGNIPLRSKSFKSNPLVLSLSSAFSGGLFLAVGVLHLMPEANEDIENSFDPDSGEHFPWTFFITVLSFALILFIEKVAINHQHSHSLENLPCESQTQQNKPVQLSNIQTGDNNNDASAHCNSAKATMICPCPEEDHNQQHQLEKDSEFQDSCCTSSAKDITSSNLGKTVTTNLLLEEHQLTTSPWTPYILQIAIGIHAVFEGLAIGLETESVKALSIAAAVVCHKWAEGLTLGLAFKKADTDLTTSSYMITIQAIMNPIGVGIGWILSNQGDLITGIFMSVSAGTFIYIATLEVIIEEFNMKRFRFLKFVFFLIAVGFITSLWFIEQATGA